MSSKSRILSQTLHSITKIKLNELAKQRSSFANQKDQILAHAKGSDQARVRALLDGLASLYGLDSDSSDNSMTEAYYRLDKILSDRLKSRNILHYLRQSSYDPSIPSTLLPSVEEGLRQVLDQRTERLEYADLYSRLLTEWLRSDAAGKSPIGSAIETTPDIGSEEGKEDFEFVERQQERLKQLSEKFESVVFSPLNVDKGAIETLLETLFKGEEAEKALKSLRRRIQGFGERMASNKRPFGIATLTWCIKGLLKSDLISDQKKNTLEEFLKDEVVMNEVNDVLNVRFADLKHWNWETNEGIPVEPRRQLNGKYRVVMDEDILQSIFVHYIFTEWAVVFRDALLELVKNPRFWQLADGMPREEREKRTYYLGEDQSPGNVGVANSRQDRYLREFFMCQLPTKVDQDTGYDDEDSGEETTGQRTTPTGVKQKLLRTLGAEVLLNQALKGQVAVVQSDLQWFATSTSHQTVDILVKFFGVPKIWRDFFQRYLQAPLRIVGLDGESGQVRTRRRGVPIGHVAQKLFGELIIFTMDVAVNQQADMLLYRLHDDLWLCGDPSRCAKAWAIMERSAKILGVEFNQAKTGSVYITEPGVERNAQISAAFPTGKVVCGFLQLEESGKWSIDQIQVDAHTKQLSKQLAECSSVFAWVQTWNSCIGRFFNSTFGEPAHCFGMNHVDMILDAHKRIQEDLFQGGDSKSSNVTHFLKTLIFDRFGTENIPDAFLFFPEEMGGLGLRNPFIPFLVVRDQVTKDPRSTMDNFFSEEEAEYRSAKTKFDHLSEGEKEDRLAKIIGKSSKHSSSSRKSANRNEQKVLPGWAGPEDDDFFSVDDFTRYRLSSSQSLDTWYQGLMERPYPQEIEVSREVLANMDDLKSTGQIKNWYELSLEQRWLIELYSSEVFKRFGGLTLVDNTLLPIGVMKVLRSRKVLWQTVL